MIEKIKYFNKEDIIKEQNGYDYDLSYYIGGLRIGKKYFNKIILKEIDKYISKEEHPTKTKINEIEEWYFIKKVIKVICDDKYDFEVDFEKFCENIIKYE